MKFDNIERLFRSKFNEPSTDDLDWMDPSDAIFEKAFATYKEDDNNRKPLFWRLGASGVFLALITAGALFWWSGSEDIQDVNPIVSDTIGLDAKTSNYEQASSNVLDTQQDQYTSNSSKVANESGVIASRVINNRTRKIQKNESIDADRVITVGSGINVQQKDVAEQANLDSYGDSSLEERSLNSDISSGRTNTYDVSSNNLSNESGNSISIGSSNDEAPLPNLRGVAVSDAHSIESVKNEILILPILGITALQGADLQTPVLESAPIIVKNGEEFVRSKSISVFGGRNYSSISHNADEFRHLMQLGGNQELQSGWSVGADFRTDINSKWTLIGGVSFNKINLQAWTRSSSTFNSSFASVNAGRRVFNTDVGFVSPTTGFIDNAEFVIDDVGIENGDIFNHNMEIDQDISIITTNVGISRSLIRSNRFALSAELSVGLDYISRIQENLNLEVTFEDKLVYQKRADWVNHNGINRVGANVGLSIRAELSLSDRFGLFVSPSYKRSVTSIKDNEIIQTRSFYNLYNLNTGISFRF